MELMIAAQAPHFHGVVLLRERNIIFGSIISNMVLGQVPLTYILAVLLMGVGVVGALALLLAVAELSIVIVIVRRLFIVERPAVVLHPKLAILKLARLMAVGALLVLVRFHVGVVINIDLVQIPILPMVEQVVLV